MVEIFGKLGIDGTIFFSVWYFYSFSSCFKKFYFSPITETLNDREDKTTGLEGKADKIPRGSEFAKRIYRLKLAEARQGFYLDFENKKEKLRN